MDESSRDDNARAKLLENDENNVVLRDDVEPCGEYRKKNSSSTRDQNDKEQTDTQRDVVVTIWSIAVAFLVTAANAVTGWKA
jgi:hypothetical protein